MKDPITDQGKKSYKGFVSVIKEDGQYKTVEGEHPEDLLQTVFKDGQLVKDFTWQEVKDLYNSELGGN